MRVKFFSEKSKANKITPQIQRNVKKLLSNGLYTNGNYVKKFENLFKNYCKSKYCVAVNNGTSALHLSLIALGIKKNDEIIVPSITFIASAASITYLGAKPIFVDINESDWLINTDLIEKSITKKTKAIMVVHLHGLMCDMDKIKRISKKHNLKIIEDASQAHGSLFKNKPPGYYSDVATFSFYPTKNLGAVGEGGAIITNDKNIYEQSKRMRTWSHKKYDFYEISFNYRMTEFAALSLNTKLNFLNSDIKKRISIANRYKKKLNIKSYSIFCNKLKRHSFHIFAIRVNKNKREEIINQLKKKGIDTNIHYPYSLPKLKIFSGKKYFTKSPIANDISQELISIPIYPELETKKVNYTSNCINQIVKNFG